MERHANFAMIGLATVSLFLGLMVFIVWLAGLQFTQSFALYDIVFVGPVQDFSVGAEVQFNGIKVGEATRIAIDKTNPKNVVARIKISSDVPIRQDSVASLEPHGITGVDHVQLTAGTASKPLLISVTPLGRVPVIASKPSVLADLLNGGGTVLASAVESLNRVNRILSDENIKSLTTTMANVQDISAQVRQKKLLLDDADSSLKSIDQAARSLTRLTDASATLVNGDGRRALRGAADAAEQIKAVSVDTRALVAKLQGPTSDFATNGLPRLTGAITTLQEAAKSMKRLADEAQQSPRGLLVKAPLQEVHIKP